MFFAVSYESVLISIHAPQWGATPRFQGSCRPLPISIHAPQWGATCVSCSATQSAGISIHAPQWGATRHTRSCNPPTGYFNPRTPVGCDSAVMVSSLKDRYFNPRTPVGCDHTSTWMVSVVSVVSVFQSTHPSGVRRLASALRGTAARFQSTHPSGVRHLQLSHLTYRFEISIHAPQWGATNTRLSALPCLGHFNPRTPVGCDRVRSSLGSSQSGFQSTHPSGVRPFVRYTVSAYPLLFQSTHPSGVRP